MWWPVVTNERLRYTCIDNTLYRRRHFSYVGFSFVALSTVKKRESPKAEWEPSWNHLDVGMFLPVKLPTFPSDMLRILHCWSSMETGAGFGRGQRGGIAPGGLHPGWLPSPLLVPTFPCRFGNATQCPVLWPCFQWRCAGGNWVIKGVVQVLSEQRKDELASLEVPPYLDSLITLAIRLDSWQWGNGPCCNRSPILSSLYLWSTSWFSSLSSFPLPLHLSPCSWAGQSGKVDIFTVGQPTI